MNYEREVRLQQLLEQRLSNLNQDLEKVWWQEGTQVRARGVQRSMNRLLLTLLVVAVLMVVTCATALYKANHVDYPPPEPLPTVEQTTLEPSPSPTGSASPSPGVSAAPSGLAAVPLEALLNPNDVGADFKVAREASQGPNATRLALNSCVGTVEDAITHWLGSRGRTLTGPGDASIEEEVSAFEPGWAASFMSEWRQRINACPVFGPPSASTRTYLSTMDLRSLGPDAFVVRREVTVDGGTGYVAWSAFVRQGEFVAYVGENQGEQFVRDVAAKATGRLCAAVC